MPPTPGTLMAVVADPGTGQGPHTVTWTNGGMKTIYTDRNGEWL